MKNMKPMPVSHALGLVAGLFLTAALAPAQGVVAVSDLEFTGPEPKLERVIWLSTLTGPTLLPRVTLEGTDAMVGYPPIKSGINYGALLDANVALSIAGLPEGDLSGTFFISDENGHRMEAFPVTVPREKIRIDADASRRAAAAYYSGLAGTGSPGTPWFRRRAKAHGADGTKESTWGFLRSFSRDDTFAMFTGGKALAENLRLEDAIDARGADDELVSIDDVDGVRVPGMRWDGLLRKEKPAMDFLARAIPEDQHAVFFPSFDAMVDVADQLSDSAKPFVHLFDGRAERSLVRERYEAQLCLQLDGLTRALGGQVIREAAVTGSDPYMRTGTDVALLLRGNPEAIGAFLRPRLAAAAEAGGVQVIEGKIAGWPHFSAHTQDRSLSSFVALTDSMVVVANSSSQLRRVLEANDGTAPRLADAEEYQWFRQRYPIGEGEEDAFVVVSDAAIRRWAGPHWRIATARRTKAAAFLADADAYMIGMSLGVAEIGAAPVELGVIGAGGLDLSGSAARDTVYGTRAFLTPIAELEVTTVSKSEVMGYERWRRGFEASWGGAFDPIAVRIDANGDGLDVDLTLVPLTLRTDYREFIDIAGNKDLGEKAPAPHPEALIYWASAIDREGRTFRQWSSILPDRVLGENGAIDWVGDHVAIWLDEDDEYFEGIRDMESMDSLMEGMLRGLPVGMRVAVDSQFGAAGFLTGVRALVEEAIPGMLLYESHAHGERQYVGVSLVDDMGFEEPPTLYYVLLPQGLIFSFSDRVIERAIDRASNAAQEDPATVDWSDRGVALHVRGEAAKLADIEWLNLAVKDQLRSRSWGNLAILNEWRALGAKDPGRFHEERWGARLECPGGGEYVWNEEHQTMESTAYGHPAAPVDGPALPPALGTLSLAQFGLSFETHAAAPVEQRAGQRVQPVEEVLGLRAKVLLRR